MKHGRLLTNVRKNKMGLGAEMCEFCNDLPETILHVMRDCPIIMLLWLSVVHSSARNQFFGYNIDDWAMAFYFAWSSRNKGKHNDEY
jgi:hypothetical protein